MNVHQIQAHTQTLEDRIEHYISGAIASAEWHLTRLLTLEADRNPDNMANRSYHTGALHAISEMFKNTDHMDYSIAITMRRICPECRCLIITITCPCKGGERV